MRDEPCFSAWITEGTSLRDLGNIHNARLLNNSIDPEIQLTHVTIIWSRHFVDAGVFLGFLLFGADCFFSFFPRDSTKSSILPGSDRVIFSSDSANLV